MHILQLNSTNYIFVTFSFFVIQNQNQFYEDHLRYNMFVMCIGYYIHHRSNLNIKKKTYLLFNNKTALFFCFLYFYAFFKFSTKIVFFATSRRRVEFYALFSRSKASNKNYNGQISRFIWKGTVLKIMRIIDQYKYV